MSLTFGNGKFSLPREQLLPLASVAGAALALYTAYRATRTSKDAGYDEIPSPKGSLPYLGHLISLGNEPAVQMAKWQRECGPIFRVYMGVQPWIMIGDPYLAHEIFVTNGAATSGRPFQVYSHRYYSMDQRGLVFPDSGKRWKKIRTVALDILAPKFVDKFSEVMWHEADDLVSRLVADQDGLDPLKTFQFTSMNIILTTCLGKRAKNMDDPLFRNVVAVVDEGMKLCGADNDMSTFLPIIDIFDVFVRKERGFRDFVEKKRNPLFRRLLKEALEGDSDCLLKSMYDQKDEFELDDDNILVAMNDLIAAGADTIGVTLTWQTAILCHYPEVQKKIQAEVDAFIKEHGRLPSFAERNSFPYLISVHKECFRYKPTTPFGLLHSTTEDVVVRNYKIPKGTVLVSNMFAVHRNENVYPNADKFIPERFMDNLKSMSASANSKIEQRDQYNFGWGRRICPGIYLAENEMFNALVRIFARCTIEPVLGADGKPVYPDLNGLRDGGLVVLPLEYKVRFVKREDSLI
ncbi:cytochrome P450 [Syncephalastrum racemosum]|uniref:Cytochrome P450 n=1 Tax=Syncephalastrum racemosum TaxID=13706 RepID=A0A1X2HS94_SYNRA|nr:cytochrome P450 [Syncephalastrum racemosum]